MLQLDLQSRQPIYEQLVLKLSEMIAAGVFGPEEQLPSVRSIARDLGVNPNTVQKSYQELERRGVIYSVAGRGSFITPGQQAGDLLRTRSKDGIRQALEDGKRSGVTRDDAHDMVNFVYGEDEKHD